MEPGESEATVLGPLHVRGGLTEASRATQLGQRFDGRGAVQAAKDLLLAVLAGSHARHALKGTDYSRSGFYAAEGAGQSS